MIDGRAVLADCKSGKPITDEDHEEEELRNMQVQQQTSPGCVIVDRTIMHLEVVASYSSETR